jgi:hypothetical protein
MLAVLTVITALFPVAPAADGPARARIAARTRTRGALLDIFNVPLSSEARRANL